MPFQRVEATYEKAIARLANLSSSSVAYLFHLGFFRDIPEHRSVRQIWGHKEKISGSKVERVRPAWAQDTDELYQITGQGLDGTIVVKFSDLRPIWKKLSDEAKDNEAAVSFKESAEKPEAEALTVDWVRWVPPARFPLQRLITKYGKPDNSGFRDDNFEPYRAWKNGVTAYLTDDEKNVESIDFNFTDDDFRDAYLKRKQPIPDFVKPKTAVSKKK